MKNIIVRTNGEPFATRNSAEQQLSKRFLRDTHEVVEHGGGFGLVPMDSTTAPTTAFDTLIEAARKRNEARGALQEAESEFQSALSAANAELGEGFEIRERTEPEEDMNDPANWRVGDLITSTEQRIDITEGKQYVFNGIDEDGDYSIVEDDSGDDRHLNGGCAVWHSHPA